MTFLFDYGDNWQFGIELIGANPEGAGGEVSPGAQAGRQGAEAVPTGEEVCGRGGVILAFCRRTIAPRCVTQDGNFLIVGRVLGVVARPQRDEPAVLLFHDFCQVIALIG
jgi:hypothetical protein